jgi:adsorption protein B
MMVERLLQRMIAIKRVYGWGPTLLAIPRALYGNVLNLHALIRAYRIYYTAYKSDGRSKRPSWDKTDHYFPGSHILTPYRKKIGDLLLEKKRITQEDLDRAILEQQQTGARLGQVLCQLNLISPRELLQVLSKQYDLELITQSKLLELAKKEPLAIPKQLNRWLIKQDINALAFDECTGVLTLSIEDPTNELLIEQIINRIRPYKAQFVLIDHA